MAYYTYKELRDVLMKAGWIEFDDGIGLRPVDTETYGDEIENSYNGNLFSMGADRIQQLEAIADELAERLEGMKKDEFQHSIENEDLVEGYNKAIDDCLAALKEVQGE